MIVQESDPVPRFAEPVYAGFIDENQEPPVEIIDLTTSDEQNGRAVTYEIVSGNDGKWLYNQTPCLGSAVTFQVLKDSIVRYIVVS